jgi:hypothetical protein
MECYSFSLSSHSFYIAHASILLYEIESIEQGSINLKIHTSEIVTLILGVRPLIYWMKLRDHFMMLCVC